MPLNTLSEAKLVKSQIYRKGPFSQNDRTQDIPTEFWQLLIGWDNIPMRPAFFEVYKLEIQTQGEKPSVGPKPMLTR